MLDVQNQNGQSQSFTPNGGTSTYFNEAASCEIFLKNLSHILDLAAEAFENEKACLSDYDVQEVINAGYYAEKQILTLRPILDNGVNPFTLFYKSWTSQHSKDSARIRSLHYLEEAQMSAEVFRQSLFNTTRELDNGAKERVNQALSGLEMNGKYAKIMPLTEKMNRDMATAQAKLACADDPEAPDVGLLLLKKQAETNCRMYVNPWVNSDAAYAAWSFHKSNRGFTNHIDIAPKKVTSDKSLIGPINHEIFHALSNLSAPALKSSPWSPETRVIIHPEQWPAVIDICERVAIAETAYINSRLAIKDGLIYEASELDSLSAREFEIIRSRSSSLQEAKIAAALEALNKGYYKHPVGDQVGYTFEHHYARFAIKGFRKAMDLRDHYGLNDNVIFVRIDNGHLKKMGDFGIGPNCLGGDFFDRWNPDAPRTEHRQILNELCSKYNIPALENCPLLDTGDRLERHNNFATGHNTSPQLIAA